MVAMAGCGVDAMCCWCHWLCMLCEVCCSAESWGQGVLACSLTVHAPLPATLTDCAAAAGGAVGGAAPVDERKSHKRMQGILLRLSHHVACAVPLPLLLPLFVTGAAAAGAVGEAGPYQRRCGQAGAPADVGV